MSNNKLVLTFLAVVFGWRRWQRRRENPRVVTATTTEHLKNLTGEGEGCWSYGAREYFQDGAGGIAYVPRRFERGRYWNRQERLYLSRVARWLRFALAVEFVVVVWCVYRFLVGGA